MENPENEIRGVVLQLASSSSPDLQRRTIERYMTPDVGFRHPICSVESGPNSRKTVLGIYRWYKVLCPHVDLRVNSVAWDSEHAFMFLDIEQFFKLFFLPIRPAPSRFCVRLTLRREEDGLYYIAMQEDFYHPDDFMSLLLPPLTPLIRFILIMTGLISSLLSNIAHFLGFWQTLKQSGSSRGDSSEDDLYSDADRHY